MSKQKSGKKPTPDEVKMKIDLLMVNILMKSASIAQVKEIAQLANSHALFPYFKQQLNKVESEMKKNM